METLINSINWDAVGGITQIITIIYLVYQFHYLPGKARKEALFNLHALFEISRTKVDKLINEMTLYYMENNCEYGEFLPGITFRAQLLQLHHLQINDLNDEVLKNIVRIATSDALIATAVDSINKQIFAFTQLEAHFNTTFKYKQV